LRRAGLLMIATMLLVPPVAEAAFPGQNGKIAFMAQAEDGSIPCAWTINPDGTGRIPLESCSNFADVVWTWPAWAPDGSRLAFNEPDSQGIDLMNADGSGRMSTSQGGGDIWGITWSPDASRIGFSMFLCDGGDCQWAVSTFGADDTDLRHVADANVFDLEWSPDGSTIALEAQTRVKLVDSGGGAPVDVTPAGMTEVVGVSWSPDGGRIAFGGQTPDDGYDIYSMDVDGTDVTRLTTDSAGDCCPAWSPDGMKIALSSGRDPAGIYVMNADGSGQQLLTANGGNPDWQPLPVNAYPRPKGASPQRLSLVPAYEPCTAPNRTHAPPLGFDSCNPPEQSSGQLTLGTPDVNGQPAKSVSHVRINPVRGLPSTPADEADVRLRGNIDDVRLASDLSDYTGDLELRLVVQVTDRDNTPHPGGPGPATVQKLTHSHPLPCGATAETTVGATCQFDTTVEALVPGAVKELQRAIWALDQVEVHDANGDPFLRQGVFIP